MDCVDCMDCLIVLIVLIGVDVFCIAINFLY
jgi:hypothetical protein